MTRKRDRASAKGLLPRMEARPWRRDPSKVTYRFHPLGGKPINLGTDKAAAIRRVADMIGRCDEDGTIEHLWRLYRASPMWRDLAERTQVDYADYSKPLLKVFGHVHASAITRQDVRRYMMRERGGKVRGSREVALLSNLMHLAIDYGYATENVCLGIKRVRERPRKVVPIAEEFDRYLAWLRGRGRQWRVIAAMAEFASKVGNRRAEFLKASIFQVRNFEARLTRAKQRDGTEITEVIELSDEAMAILDSIERGNSTVLFPTRNGTAYTEAGFKAMWSKAKRQAIADGIITRNFTFHDLRAHFASEYKRKHGTLPDLHRDPGTTARVYDRNVEVKRRSL
ncbi:MAG: tyrosine-type recombinase/integrase [Pseudomonadota bacterium]